MTGEFNTLVTRNIDIIWPLQLWQRRIRELTFDQPRQWVAARHAAWTADRDREREALRIQRLFTFLLFLFIMSQSVTLVSM
jgi:hypothetical protein